MDLLFQQETKPAIDISDVTFKEDPVQTEDCDVFNNEFINTIKSERSEELIEGIDLIEVPSSFMDPLEDLDPNNINEDTQEYVLHKQPNGVKKRPLIQCTICKRKYIQGYMKKHMRTQHPEHTDVQLKVENEDDEVSNECAPHKDDRGGHQLTECPVCRKRYNKNYMKRHLEIHERKKEDKAQLAFNDNVDDNARASTDLREYVFYKSGDRIRKRLLLTCPICKKRYADYYMKTHIQTHAENPEDKPQTRQVECEVCKKTLSAQSLPGHLRIHTGEKPFVCSICGRQFTKQDRLKKHEVTHSDARPFVCPHCKKGFKSKRYLRDHVRIHTGEKPFECQVCGKKFGFSHCLTMHMRVHNNDRRFCCTVCNKACISKVQLDVHMVKHTKERNYECTACGFKFGRAGNLQTHVTRWCRGEPKKTKSNVDELNE